MKKLLLVVALVLCGCKNPPEPQTVQTRYPESEFVYVNNARVSDVVGYKKQVEGGYLYITRTSTGVATTFVPSK